MLDVTTQMSDGVAFSKRFLALHPLPLSSGLRRLNLSQTKWQTVVYRPAEILIASDVALCGLNGRMSQQKLDLFQFAAGGMAQTGACPPQVVRGERLDVDPLCAAFDNVPNHVLRDAVAPNRAVLADRPKQLAADNGNALYPCVERVLRCFGNARASANPGRFRRCCNVSRPRPNRSN